MSSASSASENVVNTTSSSSSGSSEIVFTTAPKTVSSDSGDSCTWYSGGICTHPRSCYDCLNVVVSGDNCAIGPYGTCMNSYLVATYGGYPSNSFTYCSTSDSQCAACRANWTAESSAGTFVDLADMCVGDGGCICIAACELPDHDTNVINNSCIPALSGSQMRLVLGLMGGTAALFVLGLFCTRAALRRRDARRQQERETVRETRREARRPTASAHLPQLSLSGWTDMREKLVFTEHERLGGAEAKPTLSKTSATLPTAIVEEGDAYTPMSPAEQRPQRRDL